jgi:hypothetical protein
MLRAPRILTSSLTAAVLAVTWFYAVPASNGYAQPQPPGLTDQMPNVPDQKLDAAAAAIKQLATVRDDYEQRIKAAEPTDKERIAEEAKTALAKAITDQGLSLPEYTSILVIARNDPEVQEKILQRLGPSGR